MADMTFVHPQGQNGPYGSPVIVYDSWDASIKQMWVQALISTNYHPAPPLWVPTYDGPFWVTNEGGTKAILNPYETPTESTSIDLMKRFGAATVVPRHFDGAIGANSSSATVRWLEFIDATVPQGKFGLKAGNLAAYYSQNPTNPEVAYNACIAGIESSRIGGEQIPPA